MSRSDYDIAHQTWNHDRPQPTGIIPAGRCTTCGGAATRAGAQYGARCKGCDSFVDQCDCTNPEHKHSGIVGVGYAHSHVRGNVPHSHHDGAPMWEAATETEGGE